MSEDFYKNSSWSRAEKDSFFYYLHQFEDDQKAYFLNEKADLLLSSKRKHSLKGALELTREAIESYPSKREISRSYLLRAKAFENLRKLEEADADYQEAVTWAGLISKNKLEAATQYITFILRHQRKAKYDTALELAEMIESDVYRLILHSFVMLAAKAIVANRRGKKLYKSANEALKLVQIRKYKNTTERLGLVDLEDYAFVIDELLKIAK